MHESGVHPATGLQTGDNPRFIRCWWEIDTETRSQKWIPLNAGGSLRKWYGNFVSHLNWESEGAELKAHKSSVVRNQKYYFREGGTWSRISSSYFAVRFLPEGFIFDQAGDSFFADEREDLLTMLAFLNTIICYSIMKVLCPTLNATAGNIELFPYPQRIKRYGEDIHTYVERLIDLSRVDWNGLRTLLGLPIPPYPDGVLRAHANPRIQLHRLDFPKPRNHRRNEAPRRGEQPPLH